MKWLINDEQLQKGYHNAIAVLHRCSSDIGFLASSENKDNYRRVWARDGVVCGLAALASKDQTLIATFKKTLQTLGDFQHDLGIIPSNVYFSDGQPKISYGGLVGRTDTTSGHNSKMRANPRSVRDVYMNFSCCFKETAENDCKSMPLFIVVILVLREGYNSI